MNATLARYLGSPRKGSKNKVHKEARKRTVRRKELEYSFLDPYTIWKQNDVHLELVIRFVVTEDVVRKMEELALAILFTVELLCLMFLLLWIWYCCLWGSSMWGTSSSRDIGWDDS
jgi:hypothetical protein